MKEKQRTRKSYWKLQIKYLDLKNIGDISLKQQNKKDGVKKQKRKKLKFGLKDSTLLLILQKMQKPKTE